MPNTPRPTCQNCGAPIPARRFAQPGLDDISRLFCKTDCNLAYANNYVHVFSQTEEEVKEQLSSEHGPEWLRIMDEEIGQAIRDGQDLHGASRRFLGGIAGRIAPILAEKLWDRLRSTYQGMKEKEAEGAAQQETPKRPKAESKKPKAEKSAPEPKAGPTKTNSPPPPSEKASKPKKDHDKEPPNLSDLPLKTERKWLVKKFRKLAPSATQDEIKKEHLRLIKALHPDRAGPDPKRAAHFTKLTAHLNATIQRIKEIDEAMGNPWK